MTPQHSPSYNRSSGERRRSVLVTARSSPSGHLAAAKGSGEWKNMDGWTVGSLSTLLEQDGYQIQVVYGREAALTAREQEDLGLIIVTGTVDPGFCSALRHVSTAPVLVLAPQANEAQILSAYAAGVDQYQVGPISSGEAAARAMLRRAAWLLPILSGGDSR
jgi:DNA-binding response OmpR family regulator